MTQTEIPAGYMLVCGTGVHVAKIRQFTTDLERFQRCLPLAEQVERHAPGSPEWQDAIATILDENPGVSVDDLVTTFREAASVNDACLAELLARGAVRGWRPLFGYRRRSSETLSGKKSRLRKRKK